MKYLIIVILLFIPFGMSYASSETEEKELRDELTCFPISGISDFARKFENLKKSKIDSVNMFFEAHLRVKDGGSLPERVYVKYKDNEYNLIFSRDEQVVNIERILQAENGSDLCAYDPIRAGTLKDGDTLEFDMDSDVRFIENNGYHTSNTLEDGLKDARFLFKKMVPGPAKIFVPKFTHLLVSAIDEQDSIYFEAVNSDNNKIPIATESYCGDKVIKFKDLNAVDAKGINIKGGDYMLYPVPDLETLASFSEGECE